ncbi:MAG: hypothetical protein J6J36_05580 [Clostridia bacterium]|nr:hypothetical protein [Clostridia bacterium]
MKKTLLKVTAIFAMLIMSMFLLTGCGNNKKEDEKKDGIDESNMTAPIEYALKGLNDADGDAYLKALPALIVKEFNEKDISDMKDSLNEYKNDRVETYGEDVKITYEITEKEKMEDKDLKELIEYLKTSYEDASKEELDFTEGYNCKVNFKIEGSKDSTTKTKSVSIYKISGKWYIDDILLF